MHVFLVGILQDDSSIDYIRVFQNKTWAIKYGKNAGDAARYAETDIDFNQTAPTPKEDKHKKSTE